MVPGLLSDAHLPSFLFGALLSTQISADICCAQLPGARFSLHYEHAWCPGFFIHRNVPFFISCTYTCNKKQKQKHKTKNPKQTQKTSAQTVMYDKKGLLRKV